MPGEHAQIKPAGLEVSTGTFVMGVARQSALVPLGAATTWVRKVDATLARVAGIINADAHALAPSKPDGVAREIPVLPRPKLVMFYSPRDTSFKSFAAMRYNRRAVAR